MAAEHSGCRLPTWLALRRRKQGSSAGGGLGKEEQAQEGRVTLGGWV